MSTPDAAVVRIPLTIETAGGGRTDGVVVAVMAADLDRVEGRLAAAEAVIAGRPWSRRLLERAYGRAGVDRD